MSSMQPGARPLTRARRLTAALGRVGRWMLVTLVLGLALVGFLHLTRGTAVQHVRGVGADGVPVGVGEPQFSAGRHHDAPGRMADTLGQILLERAKAGVRVFVLYDAFGTVDIPAEHRDTLGRAGIIVEPFRAVRLSTLHLAQNGSHVRGIVIDGRIGWTGGFGIDDKWLGDRRSNGSWRETNMRFEGSAVRQLQAAFAAAWVEATGAAARRGVDVRILTAGPRTDINIVRLAGRAWYQTLLDARVRRP